MLSENVISTPFIRLYCINMEQWMAVWNWSWRWKLFHFPVEISVAFNTSILYKRAHFKIETGGGSF